MPALNYFAITLLKFLAADREKYPRIYVIYASGFSRLTSLLYVRAVAFLPFLYLRN